MRKKLLSLVVALGLSLCLATLPGCQDLQLPAWLSGNTAAPASAPSGTLLQAAPDVPAYSGASYAVINDDKPFFTQELMSQPNGTEVYGELDSLGRCTGAFAIVGQDTMPKDGRGSIGSVHPTGWQHVEYSFVDGLSLYNRCHLIAYSLTDEEANDRNLVTGTRSMNTAMVDFEQEAMNYVRETGNHVAYRATPLFTGDNLVCDGILLEARSVEDNGASVEFCVYFYNVEPGVDIDYATGDSALAAPGSPTYSAALQEGASVTAKEEEPKESKPVIDESVSLQYVGVTEGAYVLNTKTGKFHTGACENAQNIAEKNRKYTVSSREEITRAGYEPSGCCNP